MGIVVFCDPENVCVDTNIVILSGLQVEILVIPGFTVAAILKIQDGGLNVSSIINQSIYLFNMT